MSYYLTGADGPDDVCCSYDGSKIRVRGPKRRLEGPYLACLGGDDTFGRFIEQPFPAMLERNLDQKCINLGGLSSGLDALHSDRTLLDIAGRAKLCILQLPGVLGQSNRFFKVHPTRNDRFLAPTSDLAALYPELDFTEIHYVRHLLTRLRRSVDVRFEVVVRELQQSWLRSMRHLLCRIEAPVLMLWLRHLDGVENPFGDVMDEPVLIDANLISELRSQCLGLVEIPVHTCGNSDDLDDLLFGTLQKPIASHLIGPSTHRKIADDLYGAIVSLT